MMKNTRGELSFLVVSGESLELFWQGVAREVAAKIQA